MYSSFITVSGGYKACVYKYDETGNKVIFVYQGEKIFDDEFVAIEAADDYCEDNNINAETDFSGDPE